MTQFLPPNLLALFAPRDPIPYFPPCAKLSFEKERNGFGPLAPYMVHFEETTSVPEPSYVETKEERSKRKIRERSEQNQYKLEQDLALWSPKENPVASSDPYKTLFVGRINLETSESKLRREFEVYGPLCQVKLVKNTKTGKARGYAFIEFEHARDMHAAYKHADGKKIDGRRVLVDVERGRTIDGWIPRRLGGGLGGTRRGGPEENTKYSGREENKDRRRSRSRSRERPRHRERSRSRDRPSRRERGDRERDVGRERKRSRSRDRRRRRSHERVRRSRSRDRKMARRSRSRDRHRDDGFADVRIKEEPPIPKELQPYYDNGGGENYPPMRNMNSPMKSEKCFDNHMDRDYDDEGVEDFQRGSPYPNDDVMQR